MTCIMPPEWAPHTATWLSWPHNEQDWPGKFAPVPWVFMEMIRHITQYERVRLLVRDHATAEQVETYLSRAHVDANQIDFLPIATDRGWMRDCGPIFVSDNGKKTMLNFGFNAWAKYDNYTLDNQVVINASTHLGLPHMDIPAIIEGGAIDVNGAGCLLTTEECLLSEEIQCRNPGYTREDYEKLFAQYLGIEQTIWLGRGIIGDDTHGHVDDLARFVAEDTIVTVIETQRHDENYAPLQENLKRLKNTKNKHGKPFTIVELPMPTPLYFEGTRLPASYANFYIANGIVLVPTFNDANDRIALTILSECFPDRNVVGIHAVDLVWGFGTIHCLTQQEPM